MHRLQPLLTLFGVAAIALGAGLTLGQRASAPRPTAPAATTAPPTQPAQAPALEDPALSTRDPAPRGTVIEPLEHPPAVPTPPPADSEPATRPGPAASEDRPAPVEAPGDSGPSAPQPAATAAIPAADPAPAGRYVVQVASMQDAKEAQLRAQQVENLGLPCFVERADLGAKGVWYRVLSGTYETEDAARTALATLQGAGRFVGCYVRGY